MQTILIAGGTGLIGDRLSALLQQKGYTVRLLSRKPKGAGQYAWDPAKGTLDVAALEGVEAVINLAGAGIADGRWTAARKQLIIDSRVESARVLRTAFQKNNIFPKTYLSASAIGYYGNSGEHWMQEDTPPLDDSFMVQCCGAWENAAEEIGALGIRTVILRIGVVLAKEGGALPEFVKPLRFGLGAYFGNGQAWYSWVHRDDICQMFIWALENEQVAGVFNAVAPNPVRNIDLVKATAKAMRQPAVFAPAPPFALRLMLGEMSAVVLNSNRVSSEKIRAAGFHFSFPQVEGALAAALSV